MDSRHPYHLELVLNEFESRKAGNKQYSLRAFARDLGMPPSRLSEFLNGKRNLGARYAAQIAERLGLPPEERQKIIESAAMSSQRKKTRQTQEPYEQLSEDTFSVVSEWYHFAILNLVQVEGAEADAGWIAQRLAIPKNTAEEAVKRLLRLELIRISGQKIEVTHKRLTTTDELPSDAIKEYHSQILDRAKQSLFGDPVTSRQFSAVSFATDRQALSLASKEIERFRRRLSSLMSSQSKSQVYTLSIQLFPVDQGAKQG